MIRTFFASALLLVSCLWATAAPPALIAFERGTAIWVANLDGSGAKKISKGTAPDLSPDGTRIAFHTDDSPKKELVRQIAIVDVATKNVTVFKKENPSENCQRAVWSPDGLHILFEIWSDNDWHLAMINADGNGLRYLRKTAPKYDSFWSACWAADDRSIYSQDLDKLCQFALDGTEMKSWSIRSLFPKGSFNTITLR